MFLCLFLEIPLFYCLQTIENNRKSIRTIDFRNFLQTPKKYHHFMSTGEIWCYQHGYSPFYGWFNIFRNILEIYWICRFQGTFTKTSIFFERMLFYLETSQKNVKQVTLKSEQVSWTQLLAFLSYSKSNNRGALCPSHVRQVKYILHMHL